MRTSRPRTKFTATDLFPARSVRDLVALEHKRIAKRIKDARKEAGLTQQEMADLLEVIQRTYQNYESESAPRIPWDRMGDIARITGKKVEWLLHGDSPDLLSTLNGAGSSMEQRLERLERMLERLLAAQGLTVEAEELDEGVRAARQKLAQDRKQGPQARPAKKGAARTPRRP